ncbi:alpha-amylase family glycosyl hydrolase [Polaribacter sp. KT 15]|uniref:alpha-amylase family glycosyl hydrolase n=1 Tax=Polaribacter sp. KT 15 TaxID=1896175 RepID=UPI00090959E8|nr:alpha-amylase family glycosyl hydrolase [Polaribacter sp. KT 15]SHM73266.1 Por secretion system C-terminal sorting domain-containing protein [Polaribacter sp. KT 15]
MKKITSLLLLLFSIISLAQQQNVNYAVSPVSFDATDEITITVNNINPDLWGVTDVYLWSWSYDLNDANEMDSPNNGSWTNSSEAQKMTKINNTTYAITFTPTTFYNRTEIGRIGMLVKAKNGDGDKKTQDKIFEVGKFQVTLNAPVEKNSILNSGDQLSISATAGLTSNFNLKANGTSIDQQSNITNYNFSATVTENTDFVLETTNNGTTITNEFSAIVKPTVTEASLPVGLKDGINLNPADNTKATLVFYAPLKEFIHVLGDFNNWTVNNNYLLKKDSAKDRFWIELTNLTPQQNYTYQYLVDGELRVADPYSTTILSENNDTYIDNVTYPDLPAYPSGKTTNVVTLLRTGDADFVWQTTNFTKPKKTDLVIYELLIRDFDALHSFDAVKARLDYLQDLGVNAIEFMPVSEFDGNESWGYNTSFHMALDKYYGNKNSFKLLIDECHRRGISVILDVVYNHASGQNPYYRMYNTDNGGFGGQAAANSPFFNATAKHSFSVFNDYNHSKQAVKDYVKRTTQYWIDEYKIDGFRWDLTKGFTQNCTANDETCTSNYQQDRVDVLKEYADYQWEKDPNFYIIFEHLGKNEEEKEWVNYRLNEGKGIMVWGNHNGNYSEGTLGFNSNGKSDISWVSYKERGFSVPANVSYMESHDEERLMYKNLQFGNSSGNYSVKNLATALDRVELAGAFYFTIPGPKMIWQFGELGYDISINENGRVGNKPILWNYFDVEDRKDVYNTYSKLIQLKLKYDIFESSNFTLDVANSNGLKKIQLTDTSSSEMQYVTIVGNFGVTTQNISPSFQTSGTWYDLLNDNATKTVINVNSTITLAPGEFKVYGNMPAALSTEDIFLENKIVAYPNPTFNNFRINADTKKVEIYNLQGRKVKKFKGNFNSTSEFSVENLSKGVYFIKVDNLDYSLKIIKK